MLATLITLLAAVQVTAAGFIPTPAGGLAARHGGKDKPQVLPPVPQPPFTGCSCYGLAFADPKVDDGKYYDLLTNSTGPKPSNPDGWCMIDSKMTAPGLTRIAEAYLNAKVTPFVNGTWVVHFCKTRTPAVFGKACIATVAEAWVESVHKAMANPKDTTGLTKCTYHPVGFVPTTCECGWTCARGFKRCGKKCIPKEKVCPSGIPGHKGRRSVCLPGWSACALAGGSGVECVDTMRNIDSCGGCPGSVGAVDCGAIEGVEGVACVAGKCVVSACAEGYGAAGGGCVRSLVVQ